MDSTTTAAAGAAASDPQSQQQRQQPHNQQPKQQQSQQQQQQPSSQQQLQQQQQQQQQPSSQHPQSKHQPQARPNQNQNQQPHQQSQQQQQIQQHQPHQQHPQHAHQGQPPQAYAPTMPQYSPYPYTYAPQPYPTPYAPYPYNAYQPSWRPSANFTPVQPQTQYAPSMVNPQTQPNVPQNRPSSANIHAGQYIDRTHNQGLQQVSVMNPPLISTAKPLASREKKLATLKTPEGKEIKLANDSSTAKKPSTTTTTPTTKPTQTTNTTTTAEHVHTLLQKVSEVASVDSKTIGADVKRAEEKSNDKANDKKSVDQKVEVKKAEVKKVDDKKVVTSNKVEVKKTVEVNKSEDNKKPTDDNCTIADKRVTVETVDDKKKNDISKESAATEDDKENQIHVQDKTTTTKVDQQADSKKEVEAVKTSTDEEDGVKIVKEAESESKEDTSSKKEEKDESSNTLKYEAGQYDPVNNKSGKKKYSREFLLEIRKRLETDEGLKNFGPMIDRTDPFDLSARFGMSTSGRNSASRQDDSNRRSGQNNYSGRSSAGQEVKRIVITSASLNQDVELNTSANPWRPQKDVPKEEQPQDVLDTEALKKKFRSILNKLTPNNFDSLAQSVTKLPIDSESKLGDVIDIVFAKALAEPGYCVSYGQMCSHLKKNTTEGTNFSNTLLKRCQNQFQADIYAGLSVDERKEKIEEEKDPEVKKQLEEELYEDMYRCRMRGLGLIKFIGELYKIEMLNDAIMYSCVQRLLSDQSEEALECLCDLLVTIGEKLDLSTSQKISQEKEKLKAKGPRTNAYQGGLKLSSILAGQQTQKTDSYTLDQVFDELQKIRKNNDLPLSKRIRFKLLDTIELREKDKWQSKRTKDNNPKKIDEIRKAHEEKLEQEKRQNMAMGPRRSQEHRRLGPSGGSSNQISSLSNESGGRGMHTSASSHLLRDHPSGDMRNNHNVDAERRDYQRSVQSIGLFKNLNKPSSATTTLRPMTSLNKPRAE